ncbi:MAG: tRNA lysidine(34) synthetase TilS, partial [Desulfobacterales bacterium]|nr:tRNA lysidine(34) synthetase TilS [Desulfobacterales bacterium]
MALRKRQTGGRIANTHARNGSGGGRNSVGNLRQVPSTPCNPSTHLLHRTVQAIRRHRMFVPGDRVLVGVSGGPDSVALLHALCRLTPRFPLQLAVAHLNHCLRGAEADADSEFVTALARHLHLPCFVAKIDVQQYKQRVKTSWEEAARRIRYRFYQQTAQTHGFSKIALGHHSGDTAELVLMNLLRGSGPRGLCGIPPVRDGRIVRPFIQVTKPEILNFLATENIGYVHDASNDDLQYLRNRIRHQLLPLLKADYNPNVLETLNRTACVLRDEEAWLEGITASLLRRALLDTSPGSLRVSIERLRAIPVGGLRRTIRRALQTVKGDLRRLSHAHIEAVVRLIDVDRQSASVDLPERIRGERAGPVLEISRTAVPLRQLAPTAKRQIPPFVFAYRVSPPGVFLVPEIGIRMTLTRCGIEDLPEPRCAGQQTAIFD